MIGLYKVQHVVVWMKLSQFYDMRFFERFKVRIQWFGQELELVDGEKPYYFKSSKTCIQSYD